MASPSARRGRICIALAGDLDRAEILARTISNAASDSRTSAVSGLAAAIARSGDFDRAETLARTIVDPYFRIGHLPTWWTR